MSSQYITEPPPTATVLLHTTAGPLTISLFAQQTPLTCRNFLQHCLDNSYDGNIFHRVAPGFVIQTGDPTGTGEGGQSIYEDREFERYDRDWANVMKRDVEGEKIEFGDEVHTRLKFNRRGLVGLAKGTGQDGGYGSQFFVTLGDCRAELDGKCTMFGRVEGDGIYNVVKIAEGECIEGSERPMYPEKILKVEIVEMPTGPAWEKMKKRTRIAARTVEEEKPKKKSAIKKKGGKALLSFGGDEGDESESVVVRPKKAKFNTLLINGHDEAEQQSRPKPNGPQSGNKAASPKHRSPSPQRPLKRKADSTPLVEERGPKHRSPSPTPKRRKPSFHDSTVQLPIRDPESPSRSPTPNSPAAAPLPTKRRSSSSAKNSASALEAEIAALKQSMRRDTTGPVDSTSKPKSALEALIPATSTRGRKRPRPGETTDKEDKSALKMLNAFRARLEQADSSSSSASKPSTKPNTNGTTITTTQTTTAKGSKDQHEDDDDEEAQLCDLHFIANCHSCFAAEQDATETSYGAITQDTDNDRTFLGHALTFEKDRLGKDLTWKRKNEEELVVIDPRERERELGIKKTGGRKGGGGGRDWDRDRDNGRDSNGQSKDMDRRKRT